MPANLDGKREEGVGLALSGGGYRATLFHIGSLWRLNELGWLGRLTEVTSVSGGSIAAAYLGIRWKNLTFKPEGGATNFVNEIVRPLRAFCSKTIDVGSIVGGLISPVRHPSAFLASHYRKRLFGGATLQDLPSDEEGPRFTIYATSLQTGAGVRFSKPYMAEYRVGLVKSPDVELATAVAASTAFPPPLCPVKLKLDPGLWEKVEGADLFENRQLRSKMLLADGGVYDNLGLERVWDKYTTVLVSDAGSPLQIKERSWKIRVSQIFRTKRALSIITEQTRALRKRWLIKDYMKGEMGGAYWGIATRIRGYELEENGRPGPIVKDSDVTGSLSRVRTRLNKFNADEQEQLINWGYALADAAMRRHVLEPGAKPGRLPYPERQL